MFPALQVPALQLPNFSFYMPTSWKLDDAAEHVYDLLFGWNIRHDDDGWMCPRSMEEMMVHLRLQIMVKYDFALPIGSSGFEWSFRSKQGRVERFN